MGHFLRSSTASHSLTRIQESLNLPHRNGKARYKYQVELYTIYVPINTEQKMALAAYCAENDSIQQLFTYQLGLVKKCVDILGPQGSCTYIYVPQVCDCGF